MSTLLVKGSWEQLFHGPQRADLEGLLCDVLKARRWFGGKARPCAAVRIIEVVPIPTEAAPAYFLLGKVEFDDGRSQSFTLPLTFAGRGQTTLSGEQLREAEVTALRVSTPQQEEEGVVYDALWNSHFSRALLDAVKEERSFMGTSGALVATRTERYPNVSSGTVDLAPSVMRAEQSNTCVTFGNHLILKVFRKPGEGTNPDLDIGRVLTAISFKYAPALAGAIEYRPQHGEPVTLAVLHEFVQNRGDGWVNTVRSIEQYFGRVRSEKHASTPLSEPDQLLWERAQGEPPELAQKLIEHDLHSAALLGRRTAALHMAFAQASRTPAFAPEPFSRTYQEARHASMCRLVHDTWTLLRAQAPSLPQAIQRGARSILELEEVAVAKFHAFRNLNATGLRTRCHGDYHLGQVLCTDHDFVIIDFEGEPARPLGERRTKHSPLLDVAGMLRSYHYASYAVLLGPGGGSRSERSTVELLPWAHFWCRCVSAAFLKAYLAEIPAGATFWPKSIQEVQILLDAHLLEKAVYELGYELGHRPDWVGIPIQGIRQLLEGIS